MERGTTVARMQGGRSWKAGRNGYVGGKVPYRFEHRDGTGQLCLSGPRSRRITTRVADGIEGP